MVYSPFDFNEAIGHRKDYVEDRLREGSPVVGVSFDSGVLLLTVRKTQRKVFEIYDRLMFAAIGNQSDIEAIRIGAIDVAHREGFERSPDDVTAQRLVGFSLSPPLKKLFGDQFNAPAVIRGIFAELGSTPDEDAFFTLNYDGDFMVNHGVAAIAGSTEAEDRMAAWLEGVTPQTTQEEATQKALQAWAVGAMASTRRRFGRDDAPDPLRDLDESEQIQSFLTEALRDGTVEIGILDRNTGRESKFRIEEKERG